MTALVRRLSRGLGIVDFPVSAIALRTQISMMSCQPNVVSDVITNKMSY